MHMLNVNSGDRVSRVYILDGIRTTERPELASHETREMLRSFPDRSAVCHSEQSDGDLCVPQKIVVERDAKAEIVILIMPGVSCDVKLDVTLAGEGAQANIYGAYVCGADERVRIAVDMHHDVPHCASRQLFKGIAGGISKVDFYGKIIVAQDAQKTEAYQENHNLLLSEGARIDTKPQLEIYADDVKCSHGATIGRLNEEEQFYMRSRGITLEEAKLLQMISFITPVIDQIGDQAQREAVTAELISDIRNIILL
ncbi:MAG: SufD family Fe-S cluster assembly protein [Bacteroidales bacterium]|nr:SufD family Fe-S cluster assembly protein [Bacteroidales bacterium]